MASDYYIWTVQGKHFHHCRKFHETELLKSPGLPLSDELVFYFRKKTEAILFLPYSWFLFVCLFCLEEDCYFLIYKVYAFIFTSLRIFIPFIISSLSSIFIPLKLEQRYKSHRWRITSWLLLRCTAGIS